MKSILILFALVSTGLAMGEHPMPKAFGHGGHHEKTYYPDFMSPYPKVHKRSPTPLPNTSTLRTTFLTNSTSSILRRTRLSGE